VRLPVCPSARSKKPVYLSDARLQLLCLLHLPYASLASHRFFASREAQRAKRLVATAQVVRGTPAAPLSQLLAALGPGIRRAAGTGAWQVGGQTDRYSGAWLAVGQTDRCTGAWLAVGQMGGHRRNGADRQTDRRNSADDRTGGHAWLGCLAGAHLGGRSSSTCHCNQCRPQRMSAELERCR
jgi:hypothetical protein